MLPTASILALYVIHNPYARLGAIVGESGLLVCGLVTLALLKANKPGEIPNIFKEVPDILAYMLG